VRSSIFAWLRKPVTAASLAAALIVGGVTYRFVAPLVANPPVQAENAVSDVESLDKNADLIVNSDLIDEMTGGPSDDVAEP
jgi:acyl dehydratase